MDFNNAQEIEWMASCVKEVWKHRLSVQIAKDKKNLLNAELNRAEGEPPDESDLWVERDIEAMEMLQRALDYI